MRSLQWPSRPVEAVRQRAIPVLFGDDVGLTLFLGVVATLATLWRIGFFITDTYAIANTLVNLAAGHLEITHVEYSLTLGTQPGLYSHGGRVFGRNYGQAALAVPLYWLLEGAAAVVELRLLFAGGWSLLVAAFASRLASVLDRPRIALGGALFALVGFGTNVALGAPLEARWSALLALQLLTLIAAGAVSVALYRLLSDFHGRRVGVAAGVFGALSLPIAFWATMPKRHVLSAALLAVIVASFARSRRPERSLPARSLAYVAVGLLAWIHAAEALVVLVVLVPIDLLTAPRTGRREVTVLAIAFGLSLLPFVATNVAISGSPFEPPRMLPGLSDAAEIGPDGRVVVEGAQPAEGGSSTGSGSTDGAVTPGDGPQATAPESGVFHAANELIGDVVIALFAVSGVISARVGQLWTYVDAGLQIVLSDSERLTYVFLRSGRVPGLSYAVNDQEAIELAVVEVAPLLGTLAVAPFVVVRYGLNQWGGVRETLATIRSTPRYATDLFAAALVVVFTLLYLPRLPLHSQITVRYLVPIVPVALYGVLRLPPVNRSLDRHFRPFARTYVLGVVAGLIAVPAVLVWIDPAIGEVMQFHALVNLLAGGVSAMVVALSVRRSGDERTARVLGITAAATTVFFVLAGLEYFTYGEFLIPVTRTISSSLGLF